MNMWSASPTTRCAGTSGTRRSAIAGRRDPGARPLAAREALAAFEQARAALRELPKSRERTEQLVDLCFEQRNAL